MNGRAIKNGFMIISAIAMTIIALILAVSCSGRRKENPRRDDIPENDTMFLMTDDTPNCSMIISDEVFKYINENDDYSYILDMMSDYFNVVINEEIEPNNIYIRAVNEKIDAEVRLAQIYDPSNKVSLLIQIAEAGKTVFNEYDIDQVKEPVAPSDSEVKSPLLKELKSTLKLIADKGSVCSVRAMKEQFIEKTRQIYHSSESIISGTHVQSLKYNDYYIDVDNEEGISIVCGSRESAVSALDYFLTEYIEMGTSTEGTFAVSVPDSRVHVGQYLSGTIAGKPVSQYGIVYYCDSKYYDSRENAKYLREYFNRNFGVDMKIRNTDGSNSDNNRDIQNKIVIGKCNLEVSRNYYSGEIDVMDYSIVQHRNDLYIMGGSDWAIKYAIDRLIEEYLSKQIPVPHSYSKSGSIYGEKIFPYYGDANLRIMSSNVWYNKGMNTWYDLGENASDQYRFKNLAKVYLAYTPDIISFQELMPTSYYSDRLLREINRGGRNYQYVDGYMTFFVERNNTSIIYNTDTLELLDSGSHVFPYGSNSGSKSYTWGFFEVKETGFQFVAFSTHLWWMKETAKAGSTQWRIDQMTEICKKANELIRKHGCPCFVMGDFNCKSSSEEFSTMLNHNFADCHEIATDFSSNSSGRYICNKTSFSYKPNAGTYKKNSIDHIVVKNLKKARVLTYNYALPNFYGKLSDHAPIYIDIRTRAIDEQ